MKRLFFLAAVFIICSTSYAAQKPTAQKPKIETAVFVESKVIFDGSTLYMSNDPLVGISLPGEQSISHYMPVESVLEQMGYIVNFDDKRRVVSVTAPGSAQPRYLDSISTTGAFASGSIRGASFNDYTVNINGADVDLQDDMMISVLRGTEAHPQFYMPLRAVLEHMGYFVGWDGEQSSVIIASEDYYNRFGVEFITEPEETALEEGEESEEGEADALTDEEALSEGEGALEGETVLEGEAALEGETVLESKGEAEAALEGETVLDGEGLLESEAANVSKLQRPVIPDDVGDFSPDEQSEEATDIDGYIQYEPVTYGEFVITEPVPTPEPEYISLDEEVAEATEILAAGLHDPKSLVIRSIRFVGDYTDGFAIYFEFASRNKLGGYVARIAEVSVDGTLIIVDETVIEGVDDPTQIYTDIRIAFQNAPVYSQY
jgi:hypothetical protein